MQCKVFTTHRRGSAKKVEVSGLRVRTGRGERTKRAPQRENGQVRKSFRAERPTRGSCRRTKKRNRQDVGLANAQTPAVPPIAGRAQTNTKARLLRSRVVLRSHDAVRANRCDLTLVPRHNTAKCSEYHPGLTECCSVPRSGPPLRCYKSTRINKAIKVRPEALRGLYYTEMPVC